MQAPSVPGAPHGPYRNLVFLYRKKDRVLVCENFLYVKTFVFHGLLRAPGGVWVRTLGSTGLT